MSVQAIQIVKEVTANAISLYVVNSREREIVEIVEKTIIERIEKECLPQPPEEEED